MPLQTGDVIIIRTPENTFRIRTAGGALEPEPYATFAPAALKAEALAAANNARLFFQESATERPCLLVDLTGT